MYDSILKMAHSLRERERRRATRRVLSQLDKHTLRDIGLEDWKVRF